MRDVDAGCRNKYSCWGDFFSAFAADFATRPGLRLLYQHKPSAIYLHSCLLPREAEHQIVIKFQFRIAKNNARQWQSGKSVHFVGKEPKQHVNIPVAGVRANTFLEILSQSEYGPCVL